MESKAILVPLDASPLAESALPYAEAVARATSSRIYLLGVVERRPTGALLSPPWVRQFGLDKRLRRQRQRYLGRIARRVQESGLTVIVRVATGDPAEAIVAAAAQDDIAAIVLATHGRGAVQRLLLGSVADSIARAGIRPTLLVPAPADPASDQPVQFRRFLVPLDGSPHSEAALPVAAALAGETGACITLVRVIPKFAGNLIHEQFEADMEIADQTITSRAMAYLDQIGRSLPSAVPRQTIVLQGEPGDLVDFFRHDHADLVVMTTRAHGGLRRFILGSHAEHLVRSHVPVLLVPSATYRRGDGSDSGIEGETEPHAEPTPVLHEGKRR